MAAPQQIADKDIPEFFRRCWQRWQDGTKDIREASTESRRMWVGGKYQWRDNEYSDRITNNRPCITVNRCKPAVDQIVNEAIENPPGPEANPVGGGADKDGADILEGMIREYEYRSDAQTAYVLGALQYACAGSYGVFELATEYAGGRSFDQRLKVKFSDDPDCYFSDIDARLPCREDAMYGGRIRCLTRERLISEYPNGDINGGALKVLNRNMVERWSGWIASAINWAGSGSTMTEWTGAKNGEGPYYVCEGFRVVSELAKLTKYSDGISRFDDEPVPETAKPVEEDGEIVSRMEPCRKVVKYVVTALDVLDKTEWLGDQIPHFWVLGPQMWVDSKLHQLSAIDGAEGAQRIGNYAITAAAETVGAMNKAGSTTGFFGAFDVANAQGKNPWLDFSSKIYPYMEVKRTFSTNPSTGLSEADPPPWRTAWEAPIARLLELATFAFEQVKSATSIFFDPTQQGASDVQSGEAIKELQSQTNVGTANWQTALRRAVSLSYQQAAIILPKITPRNVARLVIRADSTHEIAEIDREFPETTHLRMPDGKFQHRESGKIEKSNSIALGQYSLRAMAGPNQRTRTAQALDRFMDLLHIAPQITGAPGILPQLVRLVGEGSPQMEQMADALMPQGSSDLTPDQLRQQLMALQQSDQMKQELIMKLSQALAAKLPELQSRERIAAEDRAVDLAKAEMAAKSQTEARAAADRLAILDIAHEAGSDAADRVHEAQMAQMPPPVDPNAQPEVTQ